MTDLFSIAGGASPYPAPGEVIDGKYQVEKMIGEGGMGAVARAIHLLRRAPVALKFMNPQFMNFPGAVERFINEAVAASQIESDHVVVINDVAKLPNGAPYLVMEYMEGVDLAELLARDGRPGLPVDRAIHFMAQILRALQVAHAAGIIHRDMKPSNCFIVTREGEDDFVKLLDFGISKVQEPGSSSLTQTNSALGTPLYMSPEQAKSPRDVDLRSDIYSIGVIFYELLTGRTPFVSESGEFTEILFKLFTQDPPPVKAHRPDLSPELAEIVHHALARDPEKRYSTVQEMAEALAPLAGSRSVALFERIRKFVPGERTTASSFGTIRPAAAFSQLPTHQQHVTGMTPSPAAQTRPQHQSSGHLPAAAGQRASQAEVFLETQFSGGAAQPADAASPQPSRLAQAMTGASNESNVPSAAVGVGADGAFSPTKQADPRTDLGAVTDTQQAARAQLHVARKTSPAWFLIGPAFVLVGLGAFLATRHSAKENSAPASSISAELPTMTSTPAIVTAQPPPIAPTVTTIPIPSATPSASATSQARVTSTPNSGKQAPPKPSNRLDEIKITQ
jgi:serine/threonine protein kinase